MTRGAAKTVNQYLEELPPDRRSFVASVRSALRKNLPKGYRASMNWGMISYEIPLERYRDTDDGQPLG